MIIDGRCRPATDPFLNSTIRPYLKPGMTVGIHGHNLDVPSIMKGDLNAFFKEMDEAGINLACCIARWAYNPGSVDPVVPPEHVAEMVTKFPDRFYGGIALNPRYVRRSLEMIEKFVINGPVQAACIEPGTCAEMFIDDKAIWPIYEYLEENNIPLFIMTGGGNGPTLEYANPVHLDNMLCAFPHLTVIGSHGAVPYADLDVFTAWRRPNYYTCPDVYLIDTPYWRTYVEGANNYIKEKMVFGTAYPFITMKDCVDKFMKFPFANDEILENILYKNIARALNLNI